MEDSVKAIELKIIELIEDIFEQQGSKVEIHADSKLEEINLVSLDFIKLLVAIENEYNIVFSDDYLVGNFFADVNDIVRYVVETINDAGLSNGE